ncbi:uncharacterized protein LOC111343935, partial [Stylophora pistillata]|uniref:uncharacterized protein LOC111343935 n=1 Tax=Stylophora pistillata TaxID=50429 RepID=UPI000C04A2A0
MSGLSKDFATPRIASTSQEGRQNKTLKVTLLSSEWRSSTDGDFSTISRELAIQLAKFSNVEVSVFLPQCSDEDRRNAASHNVQLIEAEQMVGVNPIDWLINVPDGHVMDCVLGHGVTLGKQVQFIKKAHHNCKWIQVVHTAPEELGIYKNILEGEKQQKAEVKLCQLADEVVAIGPKLADAYKRYLRSVKKEQSVFDLTPGIFSEFLDIEQAVEERRTFCVLVIGGGDSCEDFNLKGFDIAVKAIAKLNDISYQLRFVYSREEKGVEIAEKLLQQGISRNQLIVCCSDDSREVLANLFCEVDLAIMPSRTEGFGLPALEALSAGLPVLVSGNSGLGEVLKNVLLGSHCVIDSEDPKDWAREIKALRQKNRTLRLKESKLLRDSYQETYGWEKPCKILVEKMQSVTFGSSEIRSTTRIPGRDKRPSLRTDTDFPSKRIRRELIHHVQHGGHENLAFQEFHHPQDHGLSVFTKLLRAEYNRRSLLKPLFWQSTLKLRLEDVYTKLSVVSRRKTDFVLESGTVNMFDIFKTLNKGDDSIVLVEGSPGIGKTTFCLKISHDWANQNIPKESAFPVFKLVLLLKCRDIHGDVKDAIVDQLLPEDMDEKAKKKLIDYIEDFHNQESILIILDGLDELPEAGESHVDKLLYRRILSLCYVLATSRQEKGIPARQDFDFDVLLQIEGFTEADSFEYVRKHFSRLGPDHVAKGESLIQAIQENTFLHALPSNPLNLLLLCVVFEDYKGKLPSSRTELYQIIVRCLLRRYCAKNKEEAAADDKALEEQFKDSLLALGQLAWSRLQQDRFSFREEELEEFERKVETLAARKLGLIFKEASSRKINPQHEYHFFHKTFQEYLAAFYLAHKLLKDIVNVFRDLKMRFRAEVTSKYKQVFMFVSGILGENAVTMFDEISKNFQQEFFLWEKCTEEEANFFIEIISESGNAEQMAVTGCSIVHEFPDGVTIDCRKRTGVLKVANACKGMSQLKKLPVHLTLKHLDDIVRGGSVDNSLTSYSKLETLVCSVFSVTEDVLSIVFKVFQVNPSLHSFTLQTICPFSSEQAAAIADNLAANKTLKTVALKLMGQLGEDWATVLVEGFPRDTSLTSVVQEINGSVKESEIVALKKAFLNRPFESLSLAIYGDLNDSLATLVANGLAAHPSLKSLTLVFYGNVRCSAFTLLKKGVLENSALKSLKLRVFGRLPDNWLNVCEAFYVEKKSSMSLTIEPDVASNTKSAQVACFGSVPKEKHDFLKLHSLTLNMLGELNESGARDLYELLIASGVSRVSLNIHGRLTDSVATCLVEHFGKVNSLSALSIDIRGEVTKDGESAIQALTRNQTFSCTLNVYDLNAVDESWEEVEITVIDASSLTSAFSKVQDTCIGSRVGKVRLNFNNFSGISKDLECNLCEILEKFVSLTTLSLSVNTDGDWRGVLEHSLAKNTLLNTLIVAVDNHAYRKEGLSYDVGDCLTKNKSLTTLSYTVNNYAEVPVTVQWSFGLGIGLAENKSLTTLSLTVSNYRDLRGDWTRDLGVGLSKNTSLTTLNFTVNNYSDLRGHWARGLGSGLAQNISLITLNLVVNNHSTERGEWTSDLGCGLAKNTSLTTLYLTVSNHSNTRGDWARDLGSGLEKNTSLTTLNLTVNNYRKMPDGWAAGLWRGLAKNTSVTTLSLTVNNYGEV